MYPAFAPGCSVAWVNTFVVSRQVKLLNEYFPWSRFCRFASLNSSFDPSQGERCEVAGKVRPYP